MKHQYIYPILAIAFSCASISNEEVNFKKVSIDEPKELAVEAQFVAEELSSIHLKAFEKRAMEKLRDFADYLDIITESSYEAEFRKLAIAQAQNLFIEHSEIRLKDGESSQRINLFLSELGERKKIKRIAIADISVASSLKESIGSLYEGTLSFGLSVTSEGDTVRRELQKKNAEFFLMKTQKSFGANQKMVWEIFLGDIF